MGGRGAFCNVDMGDFRFKENGKTYTTVGMIDGVKVLVKTTKGSVPAPLYSHSKDSVYAIVQGNLLKYVAYYGQNHKQHICIDLLHKHKALQPHKHIDLNHKDGGIPLTQKELDLIKKIKRRFNLV